MRAALPDAGGRLGRCSATKTAAAYRPFLDNDAVKKMMRMPLDRTAENGTPNTPFFQAARA